MKHSVSHDLSQPLAKKAAQAALDNYAKRFADYHPQVTWTTENRADIKFSIKGMSVGGFVEVKANSIDMDLDVPFLLRPFKNTALHVIEGEIQKWVAKARDGQI